MSNIQDYLNYYTGENRKAIFSIFYQFIHCLREDDFTILPNLLEQDCLADISMTGHHKGLKNIVKNLKWPGPSMQIKKIMIYNFVARSNGNKASQSAYIQCIFAQEDSQHVYPFVFGGHFVNELKKSNKQWKISHIKFDLMYEYGNNSFVKDYWNLMDYGIFYGHKPMINAEIDAPWYVIPKDDEPQSDAEKIFDVEFKLNFGMDGGDFGMCASTFTEDIQFKMSAHRNINKYNPLMVDSDYRGIADCCNFLKSKHHKEPRLQHTDTMGDLIVNDDEATAFMFRSEFNRIANKVYNKKNIHTAVNTVLHRNKFKKVNGEWKLSEFNYLPVLDFVQIPETCICFDDFICGGTKWSIIEK